MVFIKHAYHMFRPVIKRGGGWLFIMLCWFGVADIVWLLLNRHYVC